MSRLDTIILFLNSKKNTYANNIWNKIIKANYLNLEQQLNQCIQNVGIVRYNAFDDVGSELSFAIALLDNENNGFVINSIYGRTSSNVYAKSIENGTSRYALSDEEIKAVNRAKEYKKMWIYILTFLVLYVKLLMFSMERWSSWFMAPVLKIGVGE